MTRKTSTGLHAIFLPPFDRPRARVKLRTHRPLEAMGGGRKNSHSGHCIYAREWLMSHSVFSILSFI